MSLVGLYFISDRSISNSPLSSSNTATTTTNTSFTSPTTTTFQNLLDRLIRRYDPIPAGRWSLEHRLMRGTPSDHGSISSSSSFVDPIGGSTRGSGGLGGSSSSTRYLQTLTLSHHPGRSFICILSPPSSPSFSSPSLSSVQGAQGLRPFFGQSQSSLPASVPVPEAESILVSASASVSGLGGPSHGVTKTDATRPSPPHINNMNHDEDSNDDEVEVEEEDEAEEEEGDKNSPVICIPHPIYTDEFINLIRQRMAPLWTFRSSMVLTNGLVYECDDLTIRFGDVRSAQASSLSSQSQPQASCSQSPGQSSQGQQQSQGQQSPSQVQNMTGVGVGGNVKGVLIELTWSPITLSPSRHLHDGEDDDDDDGGYDEDEKIKPSIRDKGKDERGRQEANNDSDNGKKRKKGRKWRKQGNALDAFWKGLGLIPPRKSSFVISPPDSSSSCRARPLRNGQMNGERATNHHDDEVGVDQLVLARRYCQLLLLSAI